MIITSDEGMNEDREVSSSKDIKIRLMNAILTTRTYHQIGTIQLSTKIEGIWNSNIPTKNSPI